MKIRKINNILYVNNNLHTAVGYLIDNVVYSNLEAPVLFDPPQSGKLNALNIQGVRKRIHEVEVKYFKAKLVCLNDYCLANNFELIHNNEPSAQFVLNLMKSYDDSTKS